MLIILGYSDFLFKERIENIYIFFNKIIENILLYTISQFDS